MKGARSEVLVDSIKFSSTANAIRTSTFLSLCTQQIKTNLLVWNVIHSTQKHWVYSFHSLLSCRNCTCVHPSSQSFYIIIFVAVPSKMNGLSGMKNWHSVCWLHFVGDRCKVHRFQTGKWHPTGGRGTYKDSDVASLKFSINIQILDTFIWNRLNIQGRRSVKCYQINTNMEDNNLDWWIRYWFHLNAIMEYVSEHNALFSRITYVSTIS